MCAQLIGSGAIPRQVVLSDMKKKKKRKKKQTGQPSKQRSSMACSSSCLQVLPSFTIGTDCKQEEEISPPPPQAALVLVSLSQQ